MKSTDSVQLRPSKTAELAAAVRALHTRRAASPILEDRIAIKMCGPFWRTVVSSEALSRLVVDRLLKQVSPIMPAVYVRARFGEDRIEAAVNRGIDQLVIVGAGYETFAMRRAGLAARLSIFELDLPATQELKMKRMAKAGIPKPEQVTYIASDLNSESLREALGRSSFDDRRPAVFSWFGVSYYLGLESIRTTLRAVAADMALGSSIMFDYLADPNWTPPGPRELQENCARFVEKRGEPWLSSFDPGKIEEFVNGIGYAETVNIAPDKVGPLYYADQPELEYPPIFGLCHAITSD